MKSHVARGSLALLLLYGLVLDSAQGYVLNQTVADMRRSIAESGGSACPRFNRFDTGTLGKLIRRRWNPTLNANIRTTAVIESARRDEVELAILTSFGVWANVSGTTLRDSSLAPLERISSPGSDDCRFSDGRNTICLNESDSTGFQSAGVLAFTRVVTSDILGESLGSAGPSAFIREILDADIQFRPPDTSNFLFATRGALPSNPSAFDFESVLIHELGHFFGFSHSSVWRAMLWPFAAPPGQFVGDRPTAQVPDAPLADDDRTGLRVLYPDPADSLNVGSIKGQILPANPLALASAPAGVTGIFGAHVVAMDADTGLVVAGVLGGPSCSDPGPTQFSGQFSVDRLPVGRSYKLFVEPLDGPTTAGHISAALEALCWNANSDSGWPAQFSCTVPSDSQGNPTVNTNFTTRFRPAP